MFSGVGVEQKVFLWIFNPPLAAYIPRHRKVFTFGNEMGIGSSQVLPQSCTVLVNPSGIVFSGFWKL